MSDDANQKSWDSIHSVQKKLETANSADPDEMSRVRHIIRVCTVWHFTIYISSMKNGLLQLL